MSIFEQLDGMEEIIDDFVIETNDLIDQLNEDILLMESGSDDTDLVNRIFRAFHTIKGTSGFLNFAACTSVAHRAEDLLNKIRNKELTSNSQIVDVLFETIDWFKTFINDVETHTEREYKIEGLVALISDIINNNTNSGKPAVPIKQTEATNLMTELPEELLNEFISEAGELINGLSNDLLSLETDTENRELINNIFRAFHTIKGNSRLIGLEQLGMIAHKSEDILALIRDGKLEPQSDVIDTLLGSVDHFKVVIDDLQNKTILNYDIHELQNVLNSLSESDTKNKTQIQPEKSSSDTDKKDNSNNKKRVDQTIRVDVERLDNLMNLAGELTLERNRLLQLTHNLTQQYSDVKDISDLDGLNNSLGYVTTEIQESVMKMRMLPIANVFRKFPRLVRDLARDKNKEIELLLEGEDTELDRSVIEAIGDPLIHILRNAIDHGIESPQERIKIGKPATGHIKMAAYQEGNAIVIKISDDGAGIDPAKIIPKALEKGLITEKSVDSMSNRDIINLIFAPGFSTAKVISNVSGRGVGMDVVNSNISKLNGTVDIESVVSKGSTFIIKLPLTLTIMAGMVVRVVDELFIIPLVSITDTLKLGNYKISTIKGQEVIRLRDSIVPIIWLKDKLAVPLGDQDDTDQYVVVVSVAEKRLGLVVSELLKQEETVMKPIGKTLGKVPFISGATIRGDGRVHLIMDIPELVDAISRKQAVLA